MSAYVMSKHHIDALVSAALAGEGPGYGGGALRWYAPGPAEETDYQRGAPWGSTCVANAQTRERVITLENASHVGRVLLFENMRSVAHRYDEPLELPVYEYTPGRVLTAVETLKAINGFEYQACEHPGWESSEARAFCEALQSAAIRRLPGYEEADTWEVGE
jgi:hypothetical protein